MSFSLLDLFRGKTLTIPPLDGPLQPNNHLEQAPAWLTFSEPDNLTRHGTGVVFSSQNSLWQLPEHAHGKPLLLWTFSEPIISIAARPGGGLVLGLNDNSLWLFTDGQALPLPHIPAQVRCPTALLFLDRQHLIVCSGSASLAASEWQRDLLLHHRQGAIWLLDLSGETQARCLARQLGFPQGVVRGSRPDTLLVAESWRHRLLEVPLSGGAYRVVLDSLPAYPSRLSPAADGQGFWLACFAPRNRLVEFVMRETAYRHAMLNEIPAEFWIAPAFSSGKSFLEPLQCGGVKTMGVHKSWSPSRSWGLAVRLDNHAQPLTSYHSRADGQRHGVHSVLDTGKAIWVASRGGNIIVNLHPGVAHD